MLLQAVPQALVESLQEQRLVLFAGAGLSLGSGLPRAAELAFQLQNELFKNNFVNVRPAPTDPLQLDVVAQRYQLAFGRRKLNEFLLRTFQRDGLTFNTAHELAVKLFQHIITTNFDHLFEEALRAQGRSPILVVRDVQLPNTSIPDRTIIYKLHGDIGTPDRIVITQRDYVRIPITEGIKAALRSILLSRSVLFIGYSLGDQDLLRELEFCRTILGQDMPKSYAVIPGVEKDPLFIKQCEEDNIDLISDTALDFLQELEAAQVQVQAALPLRPSPPTDQARLSEVEREYRETVCEEFKWIDFKGIPVLDGYLRVPIDQLFVSLSAVPREDLQLEPSLTTKSRNSHRATEPSVKSVLLKPSAEGKSIFDILKENPKVVVLGDPGSGKTTLLRYVGYHLSLPEPLPNKIGLDKAYLPLYIPLREYARFVKEKQKGIAVFLPEFLKSHNLQKYLGVVNSALQGGEAIILLDGLDEVGSEEERSRVASEVQAFSAHYPACRLILTSRKVGYPKAPIQNGLAHFVVEPLSNQDIQTFVGLWCKATETEKEKQNLLEAIRNPRVRALAENPLLITILGRVYRAYRNLPERRAALYAKCLEALLTTWDVVRELPPVFQDSREANRVMGPIAFWIHRDCAGQFVTREQLEAQLAGIGNLPRQQTPKTLLTQIEERSACYDRSA